MKTITTGNVSEFCAHENITKVLKGTVVYFADSYASRQKGGTGNENKLIRQYVSKGSDFKSMTNALLKKLKQK